MSLHVESLNLLLSCGLSAAMEITVNVSTSIAQTQEQEQFVFTTCEILQKINQMSRAEFYTRGPGFQTLCRGRLVISLCHDNNTAYTMTMTIGKLNSYTRYML